MDSYYSLTKTLILSGIQCEKKLWFDLNDKIKLKDKAIFRSGNRFNDVVRKHYGDGFDLSDEKNINCALPTKLFLCTNPTLARNLLSLEQSLLSPKKK